MEAIRNLKLVEAARNEARHLVETSPQLDKEFPLIAQRVAKTGAGLHME
jgi:hypothetical protein